MSTYTYFVAQLSPYIHVDVALRGAGQYEKLCISLDIYYNSTEMIETVSPGTAWEDEAYWNRIVALWG